METSNLMNTYQVDQTSDVITILWMMFCFTFVACAIFMKDRDFYK
jgi:hypothetical protein